MLRPTAATLLQTAAAAAIAWLIARDLLDHHNAFFRADRGRDRARRRARQADAEHAVEIVLGVGVGIAITTC